MSKEILTTAKPSDLIPNENVLQVFPIDTFTLDAVRDSIKRQGILQPIIVGADRVIIDGHTRWTAAQELGLKVVPIKVIDIEGNSESGVDFAIEWQIGRRNLKTREKMEKVALILTMHPKWTDRRIARQYGVSPTSVGNVRRALKEGGKITASLEDESGEEVREDVKGTKRRVTKGGKGGTSEKAKKLPAVFMTDPALTVADVAAQEFDVDQLNAINRWADLLNAFLRTKPKAFSKAEREAAKAEAKEAAKVAAKAAKLEAELAALKAGKTAAPKKAAPKKAAKKGRK